MNSKFTLVPFAVLFNKCKLLKEGEVLYSSFISDRYFLIVNREGGYAIDEFEHKKSYQRKGHRVSSSWFGTRQELMESLNLNPQWYRRNNSGDPWESFIESFIHGKIIKYDPVTKDGHPKFEFVELDNIPDQA